jgi:hypothetical protein
MLGAPVKPSQSESPQGARLSWFVGRALGQERTAVRPNRGDRKTSWGVVRSARRPMTLLAPPSRGEQLAG